MKFGEKINTILGEESKHIFPFGVNCTELMYRCIGTEMMLHNELRTTCDQSDLRTF